MASTKTRINNKENDCFGVRSCCRYCCCLVAIDLDAMMRWSTDRRSLLGQQMDFSGVLLSSVYIHVSVSTYLQYVPRTVRRYPFLLPSRAGQACHARRNFFSVISLAIVWTLSCRKNTYLLGLRMNYEYSYSTVRILSK